MGSIVAESSVTCYCIQHSSDNCGKEIKFYAHKQYAITHNLWIIHDLSIVSTVQCCYNVVNSRKNINQRHPIACPLGLGMGCLLWIQHLSDVLPQFLQLLTQYLPIMDHVITAFDSILRNWPCYNGLPCIHFCIFYRHIPYIYIYTLNYSTLPLLSP